jgi:hypothetical protein
VLLICDPQRPAEAVMALIREAAGDPELEVVSTVIAPQE